MARIFSFFCKCSIYFHFGFQVFINNLLNSWFRSKIMLKLHNHFCSFVFDFKWFLRLKETLILRLKGTLNLRFIRAMVLSLAKYLFLLNYRLIEKNSIGLDILFIYSLKKLPWGLIWIKIQEQAFVFFY